MMKFLLCFFLPFHLFSYELSICCIFQNDAKYLPEWIEFHEGQGVQHFYLYNNNSSDNPNLHLDLYINNGIVTLIDWAYGYNDFSQWNQIQCSAYMHCVRNYGYESNWIAFLDTDEFLFSPKGLNLVDLLTQYKDYGAVSACWMMYGTSNVYVPSGCNLTDFLFMRHKDISHICKCIAQPKFILDIVNPHWVVLNNKITVNENKQYSINGVSQSPSADKIRINHYWCRDLDFFYNVKLPRREKWYHDTIGHIEMEKTMNEVYDPILALPPFKFDKQL